MLTPMFVVRVESCFLSVGVGAKRLINVSHTRTNYQANSNIINIGTNAYSMYLKSLSGHLRVYNVVLNEYV